MRLGRGLAGTFALTIALAACGSDDGGGDGGGAVDIGLSEFAISASPGSVGAGEVTFTATNDGPNDHHELVVVKTDLALDALPTKEDGSVDEAGAGIEVIGEIEEFAPGGTETGTYTLSAGAYVLICNIYDADENEAHYQEGMRLPFTVS